MIALIALVTVFLVRANCFYLKQEFNRPTVSSNRGDFYSEHPFEYVQPVHIRGRRQVHGMLITDPEEKTTIMAKLPLAGNDRNIVSAVGGLDSIKPGKDFGFGSAGMALDIQNGDGFSLTGKHIPNFGDQLTAAAEVNLANTDKHDLNDNAFATRTLPNSPVVSNFNPYGGGVHYMFDKKFGASLVSRPATTPELEKTDYFPLGTLILFYDLTSSESPFIPNRSWELID